MTTKRIGYSRISTADQTVDSQKDALLKAGVDPIYSDIYTGTKASRPELDRLKDQLRAGDTIVITRLDRLGRSTKDLLNLVSDLQDKGVHLEVLEQSINTSTPEGKLFFTLVASFAEFERIHIQQKSIIIDEHHFFSNRNCDLFGILRCCKRRVIHGISILQFIYLLEWNLLLEGFYDRIFFYGDHTLCSQNLCNSSLRR